MLQNIEISTPLNDTVSELCFSPVADYLAASSWDGQTRVWEVQANGQTVARTSIQHDQQNPALCCTFSKDGTKVVSGGTDKAVRILDLNSNQTMVLQGHEGPVKCVKWAESMSPIVISGSWDKTVKYWDLRSPNPAASVTLPERCYTMDVQYPHLVVGTAERNILIFNLSNQSLVKNTVSPLKHQTRTISCFPDGKGYAVGSVEGRVGIEYFDEKNSKCHREGNNIFAVNSISFHPFYGTFSTAGSDGAYAYWDKDSKSRLKTPTSVGNPITSTAFNRNGTIFAYATGYDWHKGHEHHTQGTKNTIRLHAVTDSEIKPKGFKKR
ncbi:WD40 repeat-like protein [Rozella allomycis CSF55]|uniref:WD40 repeat-like protein n=1 Tax=Rozella allomycis (strain CSF55) TaxID=988480 RepID=A0A075B4K2_ROZAC|nr:hypothetical protein O9G_003862 [Rozella allomycis CSF55]RKP17298.1 WD40 repeat-like protein [Rozella allomycis CSF55]|eukprot:EPZ36237.1 hypothetical protein O9G_003862 [Rozella allomycis CSF55]